MQTMKTIYYAFGIIYMAVHQMKIDTNYQFAKKKKN